MMKAKHDIELDSGGPDLMTAVDAWRVEDPGEAFFATLPAVVQQRAAARRAPWAVAPGLLAHGALAAAAMVVIAVGAATLQRQAADQRLAVAAAEWSVEGRGADQDDAAGQLIGAQEPDLDESLGIAVERMSVEGKQGSELIDDLATEELELLAAELNKGKG
ncbi:MAG: hypothetical protein MUF78_08740 [Candidatus Edwardsbacteria bacterium]|jgi:hypothetical protein|nr:hypothetical protein [Candidatus Edwardsbacteria bacterium]